jgi:S-adenosylmethionine hydrolase
MKRNPLITLLSDFGLKDPYVAEMKAVMLFICPNASIVDVSHEINKYDMRMGAYVLARAAPYFPEDTVHVAVVDPGVGTERRPIIVATEHSMYVGPDNGILMLSAQKDGIKSVHEITNPKYMLKKISNTFHGRDVFSPAAAYLAQGVPVSDFGPEISDPFVPSFAQPIIREREIRGEVIYIDGFGNVVTNITEEHLKVMNIKKGQYFTVALNGKDVVTKLCSAYGEVPANTPLIVVGSSSFLELAVNQGDAYSIFGAKTGDKVVLKPWHP